ncbi:hypothetical protein ES705_26580 [subsurface metagenome]
MNPFKFGTVVDEPFFIDRKDELVKIGSLIKSENHLILISPRRYGKTSLIRKVLKESGKRYLFLDMQLVMSAEDLAAQLLKRVYRISPFNKLKGFIKSFRIIPSVTINPVTGETDVSFRHEQRGMVPLEDVLNLIDKLGNEKNRIVVALDEFQEMDCYKARDVSSQFRLPPHLSSSHLPTLPKSKLPGRHSKKCAIHKKTFENIQYDTKSGLTNCIFTC